MSTAAYMADYRRKNPGRIRAIRTHWLRRRGLKRAMQRVLRRQWFRQRRLYWAYLRVLERAGVSLPT